MKGNPTDEYFDLVATIRDQLAAIEERLFDRVAPDDVTWGHVGDLNHVTTELADLLTFLGGKA